MSKHLRFSGASTQTQATELRRIVLASALLRTALGRAAAMNLPDWWIVSGAIYNTVWNVLTERTPENGIKDVDLFYWDDSDLSYEAEDTVIRRGAAVFADLPVPVEIRNQARVHLWYENHFGVPYSPLRSSREAVDRFASKTHAIAVRLEPDGSFTQYAPYGLDPLFSFHIAANRVADNRKTHEEKGRRAMSIWPEVSVEPW